MAVRRVITEDVSQWSADDIDRFAPFVSSLSKHVEVATIYEDIESIDTALEKRFNEEPPALCGHWHDVAAAIYARETVIEIIVILRRVRLLPDKQGKVDIIKWVKE